ncbi:MAG TPA: hypothetical protein VFS20_20960 [Longimicrobium sp.]|nr:hypothetical protein [Longimicrobium sp.]
MPDLWPDNLDKVEIKAPVAILREQTTFLGTKTRNLVRATIGTPEIKRRIENEYGPFSYAFRLIAPALGNYQYRLFDIAHDVSLYPVRIMPDSDVARELGVHPNEGEVIANNEQEFLDVLAAIFRTDKTRQIIHAMIAQSGDDEDGL